MAEDYKNQISPKIFAHYLPQFHRVAENSEWWGPGFTEWTNVAKAKPLFEDHYQPHVPRELGFYDLSSVSVMKEQAALAKMYGIDGFNFYFYWFNGRRILEKPLANFLDSKIEIEFSLTWANENWSRRWDGSDKEILIAQNYEPGFEERLFQNLEPFFNDPRYLRIRDLPVFTIYRTQDLPQPKETIKKLKALARDAGFGGLHVVAVESFGLAEPSIVGADAMMEFPPHGIGGNSIAEAPQSISKNFSGMVLDYNKTIGTAIVKPARDFVYYRGALPSWDNTARVGPRAHFFLNPSPLAFRAWMTHLVAWSVDNSSELIFVNAWNEWAEGAHLEPDLRNGLAFLESVKAAKIEGLVGLDKLPKAAKQLISGYALPANHLISGGFSKERGKIVALAKLINKHNLRRFFELYRLHGSLFKVIYLSARLLAGILRGKPQVTASTYLHEEPLNSNHRPLSVALQIHIHYEEFVEKAVRVVDNFPASTSVYISTTSSEAYKRLNEALEERAQIRLVENRGRNFGPMLTVFREDLSRHDLIFHLHSKKSQHSHEQLGKRWNDSLWYSLSGSRKQVNRIVGIFQTDSSIGVVYPDVSEFVKPTSLAWSLNYGRAKKWLNGIGLSPQKDPLDFPAGGMFAVRTEAITDLLGFAWSPEDFPEELGQIDGETHHMVERLIGVLPFETGFVHAVHHKSSDSFVKVNP